MKSFVLIMIMMVALGGGLMLMNRNTDVRRGATGGTTSVLSLNLGLTGRPKVGDTFPATIILNVGEDKLTYFQTRLKIGQTDVLTVEKVEIQPFTVGGVNYGFGTTEATYAGGMIKIKGLVDGSYLPTGAITLAKVVFRALKQSDVGTSITIDLSRTNVQAMTPGGGYATLAVSYTAVTVAPMLTCMIINPTGVEVASCPLRIKGDANCDGKVDPADFNIWRNEYYDLRADMDANAKNSWMSNFNCSATKQKVSMTDFATWRLTCTQTVAGGAATDGACVL